MCVYLSIELNDCGCISQHFAELADCFLLRMVYVIGIRIHTHSLSHTHPCNHTHAYSRAHTYAPSLTNARANTHTHTHTRIDTDTRTDIDIATDVYTYMHI